jgi:AraC family transcriptional regulator, regulatory protein of adaptative response / methylated-DNA-[protein]-cysteine methyltransferase
MSHSKKRVARKKRAATMRSMNTVLPESFVDSRDFARIAKAIAYIDAHFREQPRLEDVAAHAGLSEFHFNRLFRRWAGVTPKQYLGAVTGAAARDALAGGNASVLDAALEVGLSGPSRLHDLVVTLDAMTPGEMKAQGEGLTVRFGFSETPFGRALVGQTERGLIYLGFVEPGEEGAALDTLKKQASRATFERDDEIARALAVRIWAGQSDDHSGDKGEDARAGRRVTTPLRLNIGGTNFQLKVWQALIDLGSRDRTTYGELAGAVGSAGGSRAVGGAVGSNPIAWLIPCHHVLRQGGALGGYHWGEDRKRAILAWETTNSLQKRGSAAA